MKGTLVGILVVLTGMLGWAVLLKVLGFTKRSVDALPDKAKQLLGSLEALGHLEGGAIQATYLADATSLIAHCILGLSSEIHKSSESTERLSKVNLLLACLIASATVAYSIAAWLQLR